MAYDPCQVSETTISLLATLLHERLIHHADNLVLFDAGEPGSLQVEGQEVEVPAPPAVLAARARCPMTMKVRPVRFADEHEQRVEHRQQVAAMRLGKTGKTSEDLFDESQLGADGLGVCGNFPVSSASSSIQVDSGIKTVRSID